MINWNLEEISKIAKRHRKILIVYNMNLHKYDADRLYLPKVDEVIVLTQTELTNKTTTISLKSHLELNNVHQHECKRK